MNRRLSQFNLAGVLALAILCVAQWSGNRTANLEANRQRTQSFELAAKVADHEKTNRGQTADLDSFRAQITAIQATRKELEGKFATADREREQLLVERDQLRENLTNWSAAVTLRDERLKEAIVQTERLVKERDEAIEKFNDLAQRHNQLLAKSTPTP